MFLWIFFEATKFWEFLLKSGDGTPAYSHGVTYRMESYISFGNVMGLLWVGNGQYTGHRKS